jgi:extracellular elastinolytic metalloproteinase
MVERELEIIHILLLILLIHLLMHMSENRVIGGCMVLFFLIVAKGEVWAEILYEVLWNLVDKHGWEDDYFNVPTSKKPSIPSQYPSPGNKLALRLVVDGLKLQPCSPSFVDARDAILLADKIGTSGENFCEIWSAFAKRGLGVEAEAGGREDFSLPAECLA